MTKRGEPEYCTTCGRRLRVGEVIACDRCWSVDLAKQVTLGRDRFLPDLQKVVERIKERGELVHGGVEVALLRATKSARKA